VPPAYTDVFADTLIELAKEDPKIIGITAAMPTGTGLDKLAAELPEQFIDVAICEQHAVTFAAGLACAGYKPVCAIYSTFLQRGYDQVVHDVCVQNLPVVFAIDRAGAVGNDGETHQGLFDISFLRTIPNMTILAPKDEAELRQMLYTALQHNGPVAVRYPRGKGVGASLEEDFAVLPIGKAEVLKQGARVAILAAGPTVQTALEVAAQLSDQYEFQPTVVSLRSIKPLDSELIRECAVSHDMIVTIEDHALSGGVGSAVLELLADSDLLSEGISFLRFGAKDSFTPHATQDEQYEKHGYDSKSIFQQIAQNLGVRVAQKLSA
ncbi:MAG: 1-deoxy-D-xylulose-5-phosphate synthase, partial [Bdellovibrionales bacterium]|nr:1-deoxy-D-xylulose-5-phosphate synthase [Bdellovibrionales bacterium]